LLLSAAESRLPPNAHSYKTGADSANGTEFGTHCNDLKHQRDKC